jgi:hypothetical protein
VIARIPPRQVAEVTAELLRRQEYVTMGRFVGRLGDDAIAAALEVMDDRSLLHVAFVLEEKDRLEDLVARLPDERLDGVLHAAATADLWPEALDLFGHLSEHRRAQLADRAAAQDDAVLDSLVSAAHEHGLWDELLPLMAFLPDSAKARVAVLTAQGANTELRHG